MNVLRNILLTTFAASVLAGCQTTSPQQRDCDVRKPGIQKFVGGKCCDASGSDCVKEGRSEPNDQPDPRPQ